MIDLILQGTQANFIALLKGRGLVDALGNPVRGFDYCLWAGNGKFMTAAPTYDAQGNQLSAPSYLSGLVIIARIYGALFESDKVDGVGDQWLRSKIAKWIKDNGVSSTFGGIPCYTANSVRMMRATDVFAWCAANALPAHEWAGGNSL